MVLEQSIGSEIVQDFIGLQKGKEGSWKRKEKEALVRSGRREAGGALDARKEVGDGTSSCIPVTLWYRT